MKTRKSSRQGERQSPAASGSRAERRGQQEQPLLPTQLVQQIGEDIYNVGEGLREPFAHLTRSVVDSAFSIAKAVTRNVGDLVEVVLDEADRAAATIGRHTKRIADSLAHTASD